MLICIIGGGGKSTACLKIAKGLAGRRILLTTTTHIFPVAPPDSRLLMTDPEPQALFQALQAPGIVCAGSGAPEGKLAAMPKDLLRSAAAWADVVVCEADGSRHLPLKLHRKREPALPQDLDLCVVIAGLSALGQPVCRAVHCYERRPSWKNNPYCPVGTEEFLFCVHETIRTSGQSREKIRIFLNQLDVLPDPEPARMIQAALRAEGYPCQIGSLRSGPFPKELIQ